jgi:hypothetical protein
MSTAAVQAHAAYARTQLLAMFDIQSDAVSVTDRGVVPGGVDFQLSCYLAKSETSPAAMAMAAKRLVPHLRFCRQAPALVEVLDPHQLAFYIEHLTRMGDKSRRQLREHLFGAIDSSGRRNNAFQRYSPTTAVADDAQLARMTLFAGALQAQAEQ